MAAPDNFFCTLCHDDRIFNEAVRWCTECEVFLCKECEKHHSKSRMFENHNTMSTIDYQNLPTFMKTISGQCKEHKLNFELYCSSHCCPCCVKCFTDKHQKCQEVKALADFLKQIKSSTSVHLLEGDLKDLQENFEQMIKNLKSRTNANNIQKLEAIEEIQSVRKSINDYLNRLEKEILDDLESKHSELKTEMNTVLQQMEQQANQICQMQSDISKMMKYATELQMYFGLKEIETSFSKAAKYKDNLESGGQFSYKNLEVSISPVLQSVLQDVQSFGDVRIRTGPSTLRLKAGRNDQAQYLVQTVLGIDDIKPTLVKKLTFPQDTEYSEIFASIILLDGRFIMRDYGGNRLLLYSTEGIFMREVVTLTGYPEDCCFVRKCLVVVTVGSTNQTALVDVEKNEIIETIITSHTGNYAVASDGNIVVISSSQKSTIVNLNDMSHTILQEVGASSISLFKGNIYGLKFCFNTICCYRSNGEIFWEVEHDNIELPIGITLDIQGFIYIACNGNNSIVVLSPDGQSSRTIQSKTDGIIYPIDIDINRETGMMLVSCKFKDDSNNAKYHRSFVYKL